MCGPRCVHFLLSYYKKAPNLALTDIVRQVQFPDLAQGATMGDLARVLDRNGVYTHLMRVSRATRLCWRFPVLLHLRATDGGPGHFVVWMPESTASDADIWAGLNGMSRISTRQLAQRMSGAVLLTAETAIEDPERAITRRMDFVAWRIIEPGVLGLIGTILIFGSRRCFSMLRPWKRHGVHRDSRRR